MGAAAARAAKRPITIVFVYMIAVLETLDALNGIQVERGR